MSTGIKTYDDKGMLVMDSTRKNAKPIYSGTIALTSRKISVTLPFTSNTNMFVIGNVINSNNQSQACGKLVGNKLDVYANRAESDIYYSWPEPNGVFEFVIYEF